MMPTDAPKQSRSAARWPMTSTLSLPEISSASAVATMRVLTLVRFSMPLETPPKNS